MKIALLGKGKTGGVLRDILVDQKINHTVFDSQNQPTLEKLKGHDVVISFLTGDVFKQYIDLLLESKIPVVTGSTGLDYGSDFTNKCQHLGCTWIYANNFSLGMNIVYQMILMMKKAKNIFSDYSFSMNEIHHTKKLDSPSGTALSWKKWIDHDLEISSERIGDVIGIHELTLKTQNEKISIRHEALDRKIFAEGALYAAKKIATLKPGFHLFQEVVQKDLFT
jgi:4-hydroxy-tetrahydrodipicolinate reductase